MNCTNQIQEVRKFSKEELLDMLRKKVLCEVQKLMHLLYKGYRPKTQFIMEEIKLIDLLSEHPEILDENFRIYAIQYYLNNINPELKAGD